MVFGLFVEAGRSIAEGGNVLDSLTNIVSGPAQGLGMLTGAGVKALPKPLQIGAKLALNKTFTQPQQWSEGFKAIDSVAEKLPGGMGGLATNYIDNVSVGGMKIGTARKIVEKGYRPFQKGYESEYLRRDDDDDLPSNTLSDRVASTSENLGRDLQNIAYEGYRRATPQQKRLLQQALDEIWN